MRTSQPDLKDIVKEIENLGNKIDKLEKIVETRLVGEEIPDKYEKKHYLNLKGNEKQAIWNFCLSPKFGIKDFPRKEGKKATR